jgi:hypothetical protein
VAPNLKLLGLFIGLAFAVMVATAAADILVTPSNLATSEGNQNSVYPFNFAQLGGPATPTQRYQQIYRSSLFGGTTGVINSIAFRADRDSPLSNFTDTVDIEIRLSHTAKQPTQPPGPNPPNSLSAVFTDNVGPDETLVFDDVISLTYSSLRPGPSPFVVINLTNQFVYNGTDNLLIDFKVFSAPPASNRGLLDAVTDTGDMAYVFSGAGDSVGNASGTVINFLGLVTQFEISPVPLPTGLRKDLTSGPDIDGDNEIDIVVEVGLTDATDYDFTLTYVPDPAMPDALIVDTLPAEWQVTEVAGEIPNNDNCFDDVPDGNGGSFDVTPANSKCKKEKGATHLEWVPDPNVGQSVLNVVATTRSGKGRGGAQFSPNSCGKLTLNDGAIAFKYNPVTGEVVLDNVGDPIILFGPTQSLMLVAVEDVGGDGIVRDGTGDEDGDGLTDAEEALEIGTNPCDPDTDGDGLTDDVEVAE